MEFLDSIPVFALNKGVAEGSSLPAIISGYDPLGPALYPTLFISAKMSRFFKNICQPRIVIFAATYLLASSSPKATTLMKRLSKHETRHWRRHCSYFSAAREQGKCLTLWELPSLGRVARSLRRSARCISRP